MPSPSASRGASRPRHRTRPRPAGTGRPAPGAVTATPVAPAPIVAPPAVPLDQVPLGPGTFAGLGVPLPLAAVLAAQGLVEPFPIQTATLTDSLAGRDVLGQGRTGSGKTLAFALPLVARVAALPARRRDDRRPRALVLVPTRELASQVHEVIAPLAAAAGLRSATVFGGVSARPQLDAFARGVEILIACPGRLLDHAGTGAVDLGAIAVTVLDEADHMADVGFLPMVRRILDRTPSGQRMLFSATLAGGVDRIVGEYLHDPVSHVVAAEAPVEMAHHVLVIDGDTRLEVVTELARSGKVVLFTRTKHRARQLARQLVARGLVAVDLHGNLAQNARERNLAAFSSGEATVLVATDIAARGIHVDDVALVVHADPPVEHKAYLHRSGRTARAGAAGRVVTVAARDQVSAVQGLLRQAKVTAEWSTLTPGSPSAIAALDNPDRTSGPEVSRPSGGRPPGTTARRRPRGGTPRRR
jgi:superfamily II DNA/RNA helicase